MPIKGYLIIATLLLSFLVTMLLAFTFLFDQKVPIYFTLDNKDAVYTIGKQESKYTIRYFENEEHFKANLPNAEIFIGESEIDPEPFLGKKVEITGEYKKKYSDTQCIKQKCSLLFKDKNKAIVIDVRMIKQAQ